MYKPKNENNKNLNSRKGENDSRDALAHLSTYGSIYEDAKEDQISNIGEMYDLAFNTPQPVFYDCKNTLINVPNPYTTLITELMERMSELSKDTATKRAFLTYGKNKYPEVLSRLRYCIKDTICETYINALSNTIISFFSIKIRNIDNLFLTNNIESALGILFGTHSIEMFRINDLIDSTEDVFFNQNSLSIEDKNVCIMYYVNFTKTGVMKNIAEGLNELARVISFGASSAQGRSIVIDGMDQKSRDDILYSFFDKEKTDNADTTMMFWLLMRTFSIAIENIAPVIEALLWQVVSATKHLLSQEVFNTIKEYHDRGYETDCF